MISNLIFREIGLIFYVNDLLADDSHGIWRLIYFLTKLTIFFQKRNLKWQNMKRLSSTNSRWHYMGHKTNKCYKSIAMFSEMVIGTILPIQLTLTLTHYLLLSSADNLCNSLDPDQARQKCTKCRAWSGFKLFDTVIVFVKELFDNVNSEKSADGRKKTCKIPQQAMSSVSFA